MVRVRVRLRVSGHLVREVVLEARVVHVHVALGVQRGK